MAFLERRIHLITGKGGVGRTTVSSALARAAARHGKRILLAEIGDQEGGYSAIGRHFGVEQLMPTPQELEPGLLACHLWGAAGHELFLHRILPGALVRTALRSKALGRFLLGAPAFHEMGVFYHLLTLLEAKEPDGSPTYDIIIVDMPATGHALALTALPRILLRLVSSGPMAAAVRLGLSYTTNPDKAATWVVTLPEQLPVTEALELVQGLEDTEMPVGGVILNRYPENPFDPDEQAALDEWMTLKPTHGELTWRRLAYSRQSSKRLQDSLEVPLWTLPEIDNLDGRMDVALAEELFGLLEGSL